MYPDDLQSVKRSQRYRTGYGAGSWSFVIERFVCEALKVDALTCKQVANVIFEGEVCLTVGGRCEIYPFLLMNKPLQ